MKKLTSIMCFMLLAACTDDPKPKAVAPENNTPNNPTNNAQNNTGSGGKKIDIYRWILRDKDGEIVNAMVYPSADLANLNKQNQQAIRANADYTTPRQPKAEAVGITIINGELLHHSIYKLKDGQPTAYACTFVYSDENCTNALLAGPVPVCVNEEGSLVSGSGLPALNENEDVFVKGVGGCVKITDDNQRKSYSPRTISDVPSNILNLLDNPPYSLSFEKD